jgi:hypothetical protein
MSLRGMKQSVSLREENIKLFRINPTDCFVPRNDTGLDIFCQVFAKLICQLTRKKHQNISHQSNRLLRASQ